MAKNIYVGIDDKARKTKKMYVGVDGKARKAKKVYIGDANGKARLAWSADNDKIFIAMTPSPTSSGTTYYTSTDGKTFTTRTSPNPFPYNNPICYVSSRKAFYAVMHGGGTAYNICKSVDGVSWTVLSSFNYGFPYGANVVIRASDSTIYILCNFINVAYNYVLTNKDASDETSWSRSSFATKKITLQDAQYGTVNGKTMLHILYTEGTYNRLARWNELPSVLASWENNSTYSPTMRQFSISNGIIRMAGHINPSVADAPIIFGKYVSGSSVTLNPSGSGTMSGMYVGSTISTQDYMYAFGCYRFYRYNDSSNTSTIIETSSPTFGYGFKFNEKGVATSNTDFYTLLPGYESGSSTYKNDFYYTTNGGATWTKVALNDSNVCHLVCNDENGGYYSK